MLSVLPRERLWLSGPCAPARGNLGNAERWSMVTNYKTGNCQKWSTDSYIKEKVCFFLGKNRVQQYRNTAKHRKQKPEGSSPQEIEVRSVHVFASLVWCSTVSSPGEFRNSHNKATPVLCFCCFIQDLLQVSQVGQQQHYRFGQPCFTKSSTAECRAVSKRCRIAIWKTCSVTLTKNYFCYTTDLLALSL